MSQTSFANPAQVKELILLFWQFKNINSKVAVFGANFRDWNIVERQSKIPQSGRGLSQYFCRNFQRQKGYFAVPSYRLSTIAQQPYRPARKMPEKSE